MIVAIFIRRVYRIHSVFDRISFVSILLLGCLESAWAAPIAILNHGFEDPYLGGNLPPQYAGDVPPTAFPVGAAPNGWSPYGSVGGNAFIGILNPGVMAEEPLATYFPEGAPEGDNVALTFLDGHQGGVEFGIQQTLTATLELRTRYTLTVDVGNIATGVSVVQPYASFGNFDLRGFPGYRIELLAGTTLLASDDDSLDPGEGEFLTSSFDVVIGNSHADVNQPLTIRLINLNQEDIDDPIIDLEVDFDNVRLDASPLAGADFDADGDVDGTDLATWQNAYNTTSLGDADEDGDSDGRDFLLWQQQFTGSGSLVAIQAVPEPASIAMYILGSLLITARRVTHSSPG